MPAVQLLGFSSWVHSNCWTCGGWGVQLINHSFPPPPIPTVITLARYAQGGGFLLTLLLCTFFQSSVGSSVLTSVLWLSVQSCRLVLLQWGGTHTVLPALLVSQSGFGAAPEWHLAVWKWGQRQTGVLLYPPIKCSETTLSARLLVKKHAACFF